MNRIIQYLMMWSMVPMILLLGFYLQYPAKFVKDLPELTVLSLITLGIGYCMILLRFINEIIPDKKPNDEVVQ